MTDSAPSAITFRNVGVAFGGDAVLDNVSFAVPQGGATAVIGPNGAGKTTLVLALLGGRRHRGDIAFAPFAPSAPRIGYVPQRLSFDAGLPLTVREFICLNWRRLPLWLGVGRENRKRADALLDLVGIPDVGDRRLGDLSGGELRRTLLALALGREPNLLVLDEPTAGIDYRGEMAFYRLLDQLRRRLGFTQFMVCHNLSAVRKHATHVVCLNRRVVAEGTPHEVLNHDILARTFIGREIDSLRESERRAVAPPAEAETGHA